MQRHLLLVMLGILSAIWLGAAIFIWIDASDEVDELFDGHLTQTAALLMLNGSGRGDDAAAQEAPLLHKYAAKVIFQVFVDGHLVAHSSNAAGAPISATPEGFSMLRQSDGSQWRVFATRAPDRAVQVYVGEQMESRQSILYAVLGGMMWPLLIALPLLAAGLWWAVANELAPLRRLSQLLQQRQPHSAEALDLPKLPSEIQPVVQALNELFGRIEQMMESERRFTADAAHELRTPIAAIRLQAQVAMGASADAAQLQHALRATLEGCDRATRLIEQLLTLARLEALPLAQASAPTTADLSVIAQRSAALHAPAALARQQVLTLAAPQSCPVSGDETLIEVLLRNLIDNALRYSPDGAQVEVKVSHEAGAAVLSVHDSGKGLSESELARLGERFFRGLGSGQSGSGLGWSIVRKISLVLGLQLQLSRSERLGGLAVVLRWHPAAAANTP